MEGRVPIIHGGISRVPYAFVLIKKLSEKQLNATLMNWVSLTIAGNRHALTFSVHMPSSAVQQIHLIFLP